MKKDTQTLKLTIELVPATSWGNNLRNKITTNNWDSIRKDCYQKYNNRCGVCNSEGKLNCHEIWIYDDEKHIQKLQGFIALCDNCHNIKHIGRSQILAEKGILDLDSLINHFCKINSCDFKTFTKHYKIAFSNWEERSEYDWELDLGDYSSLIKKNANAQ